MTNHTKKWRVPVPLLGGLAFVFACLGYLGIALADNWETYVNARYGTTVSYQASLFTPTPPPPDNAGRYFVTGDETLGFTVYAHANAMDERASEILASDLELGEFGSVLESQVLYDGFFYRAVKNNSIRVGRTLIVSDSDGQEFIHRFEMFLPQQKALELESMIRQMLASFSVRPVE